MSNSEISKQEYITEDVIRKNLCFLLYMVNYALEVHLDEFGSS